MPGSMSGIEGKNKRVEGKISSNFYDLRHGILVKSNMDRSISSIFVIKIILLSVINKTILQTDNDSLLSFF